MITKKPIFQSFSVLLIFIFMLTGVISVQASSSTSPLYISGDFLLAKGMGGTGDDNGKSIVIDSSDNVYSTGSFRNTVDFDPGSDVSTLTSAGSSDIFISKLDGNGNFLWAKRIGGINLDAGNGIALDFSGNIFIMGFFQGAVDFDPGAGVSNLTTNAGSADIFISKLDSNGDFLWAKNMGGMGTGVFGYSLTLDANNNIYAAGAFIGAVDFDPGPGTINLTSTGSGNTYDIFVTKLDNSGNFIWAKSAGGASDDYGYSVSIDSSYNVYTTGYFAGVVDFDPGVGSSNLTSAGLDDIFISKLDSSGNFLWAKSIGGTDYDNGGEIEIDSIGNVYITGNFNGMVDFDPGLGTFNLTSVGLSDFFVSKLDNSGNLIWAKNMGGAGEDFAYRLTLDSNYNIYTTGYFEGTADFDPGTGSSNLTSAGLADIFVSKLDTNGNFLWAKNMGGAGADFGNSISLDSINNVYISGSFTGTGDFDPSPTSLISLTSMGGSDIFISKLQNDGVTASGGDTTGVFRPSNGLLYLKNANTSGFADVAINYGTGGDYPVTGDWDGNGTDTIGIYRNGTFYLRNSNTLGFADIVFAFGTPGDQPLAGDWNGDGMDTIGVYRNGIFLLRNSNSAGADDISFALGNPGDIGIAGDWNANGSDTTGVFRPSNGVIFLKNANTSGFADVALNYGLSGDMPVTGDWNDDGVDTIGVYRNAQFLLRNSNTIGFADIVFALGVPGDMPIAGNWDGIP